MRKYAVVVVVLVLLSVTSMPAVASVGQDEAIPTFDSWLESASGPLVSVIVGILLSWLVEWWPAYASWPSRQKRVVFIVLCLAVPVGAACLRAALGYVAWSFDPLVWYALWAGFAAAGAGTAVHARTGAGVDAAG